MSTESNQAFDQPEDEDLFDFPVAPAYSSSGMPTGAPAQEEAPVEPVNTVEPAPAAPTEAPAPEPQAAPASASGDADFDLDEDLFDFGTLFDATQPLSTAEDAEALAALDAQSAPVQEPVQTETPPPAAAPAPSSASQAPVAQPTASSSPTPAAQVASPQAQASPSSGLSSGDDWMAAGMAAPPSMDWSPEPKRGRLVEILALCFLVLNSALILLAWRAGSDFRETLAAVTRTVTDSVAEGHARGQLQNGSLDQPAPQASLPVEPDVTHTEIDEQEPAPQEPKPTRPAEQAPSDLLDMPHAALELALERIQNGRYAEARRGLFRLLANRDRTALSDAMVVQAEMLIARAFAAQAEEVQR